MVEIVEHWRSATTAWRPSKREDFYAVFYTSNPGTKNPDGSTTVALQFPVYAVTDFVQDPKSVAAQLTTKLNVFPALLAVVKDFRQKLSTYSYLYPDDKELKRQLADCDAVLAACENAERGGA